MHLRRHPNILKRLPVDAAAFNLGLVMRQLLGRGTLRGLRGSARGTKMRSRIYLFSSCVVLLAGRLACCQSNCSNTTVGNGILCVQQALGRRQADGYGNFTVAYSSNNTAGNLGVAVLFLGHSATEPTLKDAAGNSWAQAVGWSDNEPTLGATRYTAIFYAPNMKTGANTVNVATAAWCAVNIHLYEFSGIVTRNPLDTTGYAAKSWGAHSVSASSATTTNGELAIAVLITHNGQPATPARPFSALQFSVVGLGLADADALVPASGTTTTARWQTSTDDNNAVLATFLPVTTARPRGQVSRAAASSFSPFGFACSAGKGFRPQERGSARGIQLHVLCLSEAYDLCR